MMINADRRRQRRNFGVVFLFTLAYFVLMAFPNYQSATESANLSQDEAIILPIVVKMLDFDPDRHITLGRLIIYGDYHYGYPFYFASFLAVLPMRLILGPEYIEQQRVMVLLLRMLISVLPILAAIVLLVYLQTRFRNLWGSLGMAIFLAAVPAVVRQNLAWWHPDALAILGVVLTIFFLDRDRLRFGRFFWLAAVSCGVATAIKILGVWFVLTIPAYLAVGLIQKRIRLGRAVLLGLGFTLVMAAVTVLSNPFVFYDSPRQRMLEIQAQNTYIMEHGHPHDDPYYYQHGPQYWEWTLNRMFGPVPALLALAGGLAAGALWGSNRFANRLLLSWCAPLGIFLLWFVAPKPDHYMLPVLLPLFSGGLGSIGLIWGAARGAPLAWQRRAAWAGLVLVLAGLTAILISHYWPLDRELWLEQWRV